MTDIKIGALSVKISVDSSGVEAGKKKAIRSLGEIKAEMRSGINTAAKWGAAMVAAAGVASAAIFKSTSSSIRELQVLSNVANTTTEDFQQMAFGAQKFNIEQEKLADILKDTNDRIGDFVATGGGPMLDFFEQIGPRVGVTIDHFKDLSGPQALQLYVDSLEKANLSQADMTFFMEAIASDSTRLLPLLRNNGEAMSEQAERAKLLGLALSDLDAAKVEQANNAMDEISATLRSAAQAATVELAPVITALAKKFTESAIQAGGFGEIVKNAFKVATKGVAFLADMLRGIDVSRKVIETGFLGLGAVIVQTGTTILRGWSLLFEQIGKGLKGLIETANKLPLVDIDTSGLDAFTDRLKAEQDTLKGIGDVAVEAVRRSAEELQVLASTPMPSEAIHNFVDEAVSAADAAAAEMARIRAAAAEQEGGLGQEEDNNLILQTQAESEAFLEELRLRYLTAQEIRDEAYAIDQEKLRLARENGLISEEEYLQQRAALQEAYKKDSIEIAAEEQSLKNRIAGQGGDSLISTLASNAKRGTAIQRTAAKAQAVIAIATGAAKALALGLPAAIPEGIRVASVGAAALAKIGGGGSSSISTGSDSSAAATADLPSSVQSASTVQETPIQQIADIAIPEGMLLDSNGVRSLIELINEQTGDGVIIRTSEV